MHTRGYGETWAKYALYEKAPVFSYSFYGDLH